MEQVSTWNKRKTLTLTQQLNYLINKYSVTKYSLKVQLKLNTWTRYENISKSFLKGYKDWSNLKLYVK